MKVLVTRPRREAARFARALKSAGFEPVVLPVMEVQPRQQDAALQDAVDGLSHYAWVVFTSVNGVDVFLQNVEAECLRGVRVAAIGPKTARALAVRGIIADFVPREYVAEAIVPGLGDLRGKRVLLPRAEGARPALPQAITAAGGLVDEIALYRTVPSTLDEKALARVRLGVQAVTFASPSAVRNFVTLVTQAGLDPLHLPGGPAVVCIGPITAEAARQAGFAAVITAQEYTMEGILTALRALREAQS